MFLERAARRVLFLEWKNAVLNGFSQKQYLSPKNYGSRKPSFFGLEKIDF